MPESITGNKNYEGGSNADTVMDFEVVVRSYERGSGKLVWSDRLSTRDRMEELAEDETGIGRNNFRCSPSERTMAKSGSVRDGRKGTNRGGPFNLWVSPA